MVDSDRDGERSAGGGPPAEDGGQPAQSRDPAPATDPTAVFELLADETRLAIVRTLARERWSNWQRDGLSFSELRRAVGARDAGNFSYHLEKLLGVLVAKDDGEYVLLNQGLQLAGAVEAGRYTDGGATLRDETGYDCPYPDCERALVAAYDNQYFRTRCPDHGVFTGTSLPPALVEHADVPDLVEVAVLDNRQDVERAGSGVCPTCWGPVDATLPASEVTVADHFAAEDAPDSVWASYDCERCGMSFQVPAGVCVVTHQAVVALYHERGRDVRRIPYAQLPFVDVTRPVVESEDPVRVRVDVELGGDSLSLWLDGEASVVEYERT